MEAGDEGGVEGDEVEWRRGECTAEDSGKVDNTSCCGGLFFFIPEITTGFVGTSGVLGGGGDAVEEGERGLVGLEQDEEEEEMEFSLGGKELIKGSSYPKVYLARGRVKAVVKGVAIVPCWRSLGEGSNGCGCW